MKVLGINDDRDTCDCCGRKGLKRVVWLETAAGEIVAYGTGCAAQALGIGGTSTDKKRAIESMARETVGAERQRIFRDECRLVRSVYIPRDFKLSRARKEFAAEHGAERAVELALAAAVAERVRRWPATK